METTAPGKPTAQTEAPTDGEDGVLGRTGRASLGRAAALLHVPAVLALVVFGATSAQRVSVGVPVVLLALVVSALAWRGSASTAPSLAPSSRAGQVDAEPQAASAARVSAPTALGQAAVPTADRAAVSAHPTGSQAPDLVRPTSALPAMEPAPPVPLPSTGAAAPAEAGSTPTRSQSATAGTPPEHAAATPVSTVPSWAYAGHLTGQVEDDPRPGRRRLFGRRGQGAQPIAAPGAPSAAPGAPDHTPPAAQAPSGDAGVGTPAPSAQPGPSASATGDGADRTAEAKALREAEDDLDALLNATRLDQRGPVDVEQGSADQSAVERSYVERSYVEQSAVEQSAVEQSSADRSSVARVSTEMEPDPLDALLAHSRQRPRGAHAPDRAPEGTPDDVEGSAADLAARILEDLPGMGDHVGTRVTVPGQDSETPNPLARRKIGTAAPSTSRTPGPASGHPVARPAIGTTRPSAGLGQAALASLDHETGGTLPTAGRVTSMPDEVGQGE